MLTKDPLTIPLALRIYTPTLVDLQTRLPKRGGVVLRELSADEVKSYTDKLGVVISDPTACEVGENATPGPAGHLLTIRTDNGVDYARLRHIRALKVGQTVSVSESYTDRYAVRLWTNAVVVESPDTFNFKAHAQGAEFYDFSLSLLIVGGMA